MAEIQIVLTSDNSFFSRLARLLGAEYTHAMLRYCQVCGQFNFTQFAHNQQHWPAAYNIIEATMRRGVIERAWNPEEYSKWAVYRLTDKAIKARLGYVRHPEDIYDGILAYARGNIGKRYAYEKLALLLPRFIREATSRRVARFDRELYRFTILGTGQVCTSLVDDCFLQGGHIDLVPYLDTPWVLPSDIASSPLLELLPPEGTVEWK